MFENATEPFVDLRLVETIGSGTGVGSLTVLLALISSLIICMAIIPVMVRLAPVLGMIDAPDPRKVHVLPIPRVGGIGMVIGTCLPLLFLLPFDGALQSFILGSLVLFVFGMLDDSRELGHYVKFIGQFVAAIIIVYQGEVYVSLLPLMGGESVARSVGQPFTVIAIVGMINAVNHSDGLDGLAGGESLLSLVGIAYLAYLADGLAVTVIAVATIGGVLGFMRFNTYPARIFMGDSGSQFLGYVLGVLAVMLTQQVNTALSPAIVLLLLGLPIADIIAVFAQRMYHKMNWFRATRNHIHHRLLDLGFHHYESVIAVYSVQAAMVTLAVILAYESDMLILGVYALIVLLVFAFLTVAEKRGWRLRLDADEGGLDGVISSVTHNPLLLAIPYGLVLYGVSAYLIAGALLSTTVPADFAYASIALFALLLMRLSMGPRSVFLPIRPLVYVGIIFVVYLSSIYQPEYLAGADPFTYAFFGILVVGIALSIRFAKSESFDVSPMDYLVVMAIIIVVVLESNDIVEASMTAVALKGIILFYGGELILTRMTRRINVFTLAMLLSLLIIGIRGAIINF